MILRVLVTFVALLAVIVCASNSPAFALDTNDGVVVERRAYSFPSYEKALQTTNVKDYATKDEYQNAINDTNFEFQKLKYMSDGLKVWPTSTNWCASITENYPLSSSIAGA